MISGFAIFSTIVFGIIACACFYFARQMHEDASSGGDFGSVISDVIATFLCLIGFASAALSIIGACALVFGGQ